MSVLKKYYKRELVASAIFFIVLVWFIGWWRALLVSAILFPVNLMAIDYFLKERRIRRQNRVDEALLRKEAERIEARRDEFHGSGR
jgi:membrane protein implicated in regulation of membrane protease activity